MRHRCPEWGQLPGAPSCSQGLSNRARPLLLLIPVCLPPTLSEVPFFPFLRKTSLSTPVSLLSLATRCRQPGFESAPPSGWALRADANHSSQARVLHTVFISNGDESGAWRVTAFLGVFAALPCFHSVLGASAGHPHCPVLGRVTPAPPRRLAVLS